MSSLFYIYDTIGCQRGLDQFKFSGHITKSYQANIQKIIGI